MIEEAKEEVP